MNVIARAAFATAGVAAAACTSDPSALDPDPALVAERHGASSVERGAVYVASNAAAGNQILIFVRAPNGSLSGPETVATGGTGTGGGLGNQAGLVLLPDRRLLLVVNAGSNDVSVFRVSPHGITLLDREPSGGATPVSIAVHDQLVYVLNDGGTANIAGFRLKDGGNLVPISGSIRPLSAAAPDAAQIAFGAGGQVLIVTEKATNLLSTYTVDGSGLAQGPNPQPSAGMTPFGFAVRRGLVVVSEAFGGAPDGSALSSYELGAGGTLNVISASVGTTETAACWVVITPDGRYTYTTNTGSGTISGYSIGPTGSLHLLDANGVTATTSAGPIDLALAQNGRFLYSLDEAGGTISAFEIESDGSLVPIGGAVVVPQGANGLAAR